MSAMWYLLLLWLPLTLNAATISEVVVYPQGATIRQEQSLELSAGVSEVVWGALSPSVDIGSIRVELPEGVRLIDREVVGEQLAQEGNAKRAALEGMLKKAQQSLQDIDDKIDLIVRQERYIDGIQTASTSPVKGEAAFSFPTPQQWEGLLTFVKEKRAQLIKERRAAQEERQTAQQEVDRLNRAIADLNNQPTLYTQKLKLKLEALKAQKAEVGLSYYEANAGWQPTYEVWVDSSSGKIKLTYGALVRQYSGVDWQEVPLRLSTARPTASATPPELSAWWLHERREAPVRMYAAAKSSMALAGVAEAAYDAAPAAGFAPVSVASKMTFAEFALPGKQTIPADNNEHRLQLKELALEGELSYRLVPELSLEAYLQANVKNSSDFTLLPGVSQLYADGNFVGRSSLPMIQPGESFALNLGTDPAIKLERKNVAKKTDRTGFADLNEKINFAYIIEVSNLKKSAQRVELWERFPISQHEKIKIEIIEPKGIQKQLDAQGRYRWVWELAAGQKQQLSLIYTVEYPKDMSVDGL
jgi:uncharacterized protein (TIGR02231 family)